MTNPVLSDDEVASLIAEVEREQKAREFDRCAYQSKSGKTGCGALRYYHERVKSHEFVEPEYTLSNKAKMLALFNQNTALREQLAHVLICSGSPSDCEACAEAARSVKLNG